MNGFALVCGIHFFPALSRGLANTDLRYGQVYNQFLIKRRSKINLQSHDHIECVSILVSRVVVTPATENHAPLDSFSTAP